MKTSLQEQWMPDGTCFGCGPANASGLRLRSFPSDEGVVAEWHPERHHNAYPGMLCGGVIGMLLDCHTGAALAWALNLRDGTSAVTPLPHPFERAPWATSEYVVRLRRSAPMSAAVILRARVVRLKDDQAIVEGSLEANGTTCATCSATWKPLKRR
jgi:acyl-coenzyme A thioesterase PaaI-like protein